MHTTNLQVAVQKSATRPSSIVVAGSAHSTRSNARALLVLGYYNEYPDS